MNYTLARNVIIYDELGKILPAFDSAGIRVIVLAGAALGATVYPTIAERPMGDIDLLVPSNKRGQGCVADTLTKLGYVLDTARSDEAHYSKTLDSITLHIDCHTDLRHYLDGRALAGVWDRARLMSVIPAPRCLRIRGAPIHIGTQAGIQSLILSPDDSFIYTAVDSAIYHGRITANTLKDIELIIKHYTIPSVFPLTKGGREVVQTSGINWQLVIRLIKSYRLETPLYILFDLCRQQGVPIPDEVVNSLNPRKRSLEYCFYKIILYAQRSTLYATDDLSRILLFLFRPVARWELFMNSFFPPLRFVKQCYDLTKGNAVYSILHTLYYPLRLLSLLWRMNKALGQLALTIKQRKTFI